MTQVNIDKQKVAKMVQQFFQVFNDQGAHPAEVCFALSETLGRVISSLNSGDIVKKELLDLSIKHMAGSIESSFNHSPIAMPH